MRIQEEREQYVYVHGGWRCFLQTGRLGPVYSSAARAFIFIQASKRIQTVIHAGPRDATERKKPKKTKHHTYKLPSHADAHLNESLVRAFLTLALEPLFPKAPAGKKGRKDGVISYCRGGKCIYFSPTLTALQGLQHPA